MPYAGGGGPCGGGNTAADGGGPAGGGSSGTLLLSAAGAAAMPGGGPWGGGKAAAPAEYGAKMCTQMLAVFGLIWGIMQHIIGFSEPVLVTEVIDSPTWFLCGRFNC